MDFLRSHLLWMHLCELNISSLFGACNTAYPPKRDEGRSSTHKGAFIINVFLKIPHFNKLCLSEITKQDVMNMHSFISLQNITNELLGPDRHFDWLMPCSAQIPIIIIDPAYTPASFIPPTTYIDRKCTLNNTII